MSVPSMKQYFELLPPKLKSFFKKYPPHLNYSDRPVSTLLPTANPFLPNKHPVTGKYHEPKYSLRRMSDIYKLAYTYGIQDFLPPRNKLFFEEKYNQKKIVKGVIFPKGHKYELSHGMKMKKMEEAIKNADKYIVEARGSKYLKKLERRKREGTKSWF
ncbi:mitochondrial 54S ribosomal protein mL59 Ecym_5268 [Eremothecium cymbalariae DBVPG|uniref:Large ribosomal subunit protein mL59 domain-containing protein n=1 Tax=Eremothecium cymbalariae (strain CBS 270.75 / DBVPG 7215 / KCTC 17166 / NRRL Y-17582) TaxID=931890 RepID=I6ND90_ERECY|nr:hypothetical protein Ecym_5268 [Eremothecium cymbalariae DBVPG\